MRLGGPRWLALALISLAVLAAMQAGQQCRLATGDEVHGRLRWLAAVAFGLASTCFVLVAWRLWRRPEALANFPAHRTLLWYRWLVAGWLVVFLVLGVLHSGVEAARYPCRAICLLWLGIMATPWLWPAAWLGRGRGFLRLGTFKALDLVVGNLVLVLLLMEVGLRGMEAWSGEDAFLSQRARANRLRPQQYANGLRANSLGFADEEFEFTKKPGVLRIAALGDSFSVGAWVAYEDNYLTRIESHLPGIEVYNFGVCGTGPREYRQLLASTVWPYHPDLVLVPIFVGNDVSEWIASPELLKLQPDALRVHQLVYRSYRLLREFWRTSARQAGDFQMTVLPPFSAATNLELAAGRLVVLERNVSLPLERRWQQVFAELDEILSDCRRHGVATGCILIPDALQVDQDLRGQALRLRGWQADHIDVELPQRRLRAFCQRRDWPCLDLLPAFRPHGALTYFPNDSHWNAVGNALAAKLVSDWLQSIDPRFQTSPIGDATRAQSAAGGRLEEPPATP